MLVKPKNVRLWKGFLISRSAARSGWILGNGNDSTTILNTDCVCVCMCVCVIFKRNPIRQFNKGENELFRLDSIPVHFG